jgi:HNH endonuclease
METLNEPYCMVPISNDENYKAIVSQQDFDLVKTQKWSMYQFKDNGKNRTIIVTRIEGKLTQMHHFIIGKPKSKHEIIIHINDNKLDNRRCNLVVSTLKQNLKKKIDNLEPMEDNDNYRTHPVLSSYIADVKGEVFRKDNHLQITGSNQATGYNHLKLTTNDGNTCHKMRHVFVYECFYGIVPDGYEIDHIDRNKLNNELSNLQCLTVKDHKIKTVKDNPEMGKKTAVKLSKPIIAVNIRTSIETKYNSLTEASNNIPGTTITKICSVLQGRRKTHQGYTFRYQEIDNEIEGEIWVCPNNPLYKGIEVSNLGRVKSKRGIITEGKDHGDYKRVSVSQDNVKKCVLVHQLICEAFNGKNPKPEEYSVDHIDRNRCNNNASNLWWASKYEQRLNSKNVNQVQVYDENDVLLSTYNTIKEAASSMDMHNKTVKNCCITGRNYKGYSFKFVNNNDT